MAPKPVTFTDTETEVLSEMIESPAWGVFLRKVVKQEAQVSMLQVLGTARQGGKAGYAVGRIDGLQGMLNTLYKQVSQKAPDIMEN